MLQSLPQTMFEGPPAGAIAQDMDRITYLLTIHHEYSADKPFTIDHRFSDRLATSEQSYNRIIKVGEQWQSVDTAWVKELSFLVLVNNKPKYLSNPSEEQKAEDAKKIVELGYPGTPPWIIRPGRPFVAEPSELQDCKIRCQQGIAEVTVSAIPR